jgi:hypothetical protein
MTPADDLDRFLLAQRRSDTVRALCRPNLTEAQLDDIQRRFEIAQLAAEDDDGPSGGVVAGRLQ